MTFSDDLPTAGEASGRHRAVRPDSPSRSGPPPKPEPRPVEEHDRTPRHRPGADPNHPEAELLIKRAADLVAAGKPLPMSSTVRIDRDEVLELLLEALDRLPEELRRARWLLKEREDFLARMQAEGDEIVEAARARAEQMIQRAEVVKAAEQRARRIVSDADAEARRLRLECEDYCDQKLAGFEIVLERTMKMVVAGREKLQGSALTRAEPEPEPEDESGSSFFDQDQS